MDITCAPLDGIWTLRPGDPGHPDLAGMHDVAGRGALEQLGRPAVAVLADSRPGALSRFGAEAVVGALPEGFQLAVDLERCPRAAEAALVQGVPLLGLVPGHSGLGSDLAATVVDAGGVVCVGGPRLAVAFAGVVVVAEARRRSDVLAAAFDAARAGRLVLALRPHPRIEGQPGAQGLLELIRPNGARAETLGVPEDRALLDRRLPFADAVVERLADLPDLLALACAFAAQPAEAPK